MEKYMELGKITNTHGIRGEVRALSWGNDIEELLDYDKFYVGKSKQCMKVTSSRTNNKFALIKFEGIDTEEMGQKLKNEILYMKREEMIPLPKGSYYIADLIGLEVFLKSGESLGKVKDLVPTGPNDVFVIEGEKKEYMIPFIDSCVESIDMENNKMIVTPLEGLLDL